ncbi:hypothetical protein PF005_g30601 [Phytophthora fragariae]|uniref:RxLR effector protein n=2 Tax=Phytophthora fragariae TaxID=53985 RepID=A0A6A4B2X4_9STRA|nr:hypothetical protein PF007_g30856 [Phytophthora fragariae]KAE9163053.1 hypothetical protein PF005_g30601 [Phytophthora fragariae]KAE9265451.1 hypothetical protein PF001_g30882 [Phytophthora fragariae]
MRLLQVLIMCAVVFLFDDAAATKLSGEVSTKDRTLLRSFETRGNTQEGEERFSTADLLSKLKSMKKFVPGYKAAALKKAAAAAEFAKSKQAIAEMMQNDNRLYQYLQFLHSEKRSSQYVRDIFAAAGRTEQEVNSVANKFYQIRQISTR